VSTAVPSRASNFVRALFCFSGLPRCFLMLFLFEEGARKVAVNKYPFSE
jgi:hypothetical protein